jgi:hypothetical protein
MTASAESRGSAWESSEGKKKKKKEKQKKKVEFESLWYLFLVFDAVFAEGTVAVVLRRGLGVGGTAIRVHPEREMHVALRETLKSETEYMLVLQNDPSVGFARTFRWRLSALHAELLGAKGSASQCLLLPSAQQLWRAP